MAGADMDPALRVETLIALTEELSAIFERENDALTGRRHAEIAPLQADKARLAAAYAQSIRAVAANRGLVASAGAELIERLRETTLVFERRASDQRALLDGARRASEGVLRAVAEEAAAGSAPAYAAGAPRRPASGPLAIDENA